MLVTLLTVPMIISHFVFISRAIWIFFDLESELDASMDEVFRLNSDYFGSSNHSDTKSTWYQEPI
jgi:hypothetical protein